VSVEHAKKHDHHGPLGFVENLAEDAGEAIVGIPAGFVALAGSVKGDVADPKFRHALWEAVKTNDPAELRRESRLDRKVLEPLGKSYQQTYGPPDPR